MFSEHTISNSTSVVAKESEQTPVVGSGAFMPTSSEYLPVGQRLPAKQNEKKTHTQHVSVRENCYKNLKRKDKRKIGHECTLMNHLNSCPSYVCTLRAILTRRRIGTGSHV
jgi:hypothetical protein